MPACGGRRRASPRAAARLGRPSAARSATRARTPAPQDDQTPAPSPASAAAPIAVASRSAGTSTGTPSDVGLELHQEAVRRAAAVGAQQLRRQPHRLDDVVRLERDRLERRADEVLAPRTARQARDQAARVRRPVRRAEAGQRGDEVDAVVSRRPTRQRLGLGGVRDEPEPVAQPLHRRARDEDGALERVDGRRARRAATAAVASTPSAGSGRAVPAFASTKLPVP